MSQWSRREWLARLVLVAAAPARAIPLAAADTTIQVQDDAAVMYCVPQLDEDGHRRGRVCRSGVDVASFLRRGSCEP